MKYLIVVFLMISSTLRAADPALVAIDEDFKVEDVIGRLNEHMSNVETWYQTSKRCAIKSVRKHAFDMSLLRSVVQVTHPVMVACFDDMEAQQSLEPFFALWLQFKDFHTESAQDRLLCKEAAFLIMHLYSTMLCELQRSTTRVTVSQMLELYKVIAALPMYELLALLDGIAREIIGLLDQTYQGENSFFVWLWHNWWVPPMIISHSLNKLLDGLITIMLTEKPDSTGTAKEDDKKTVIMCAL
jgi:hypothetical protein